MFGDESVCKRGTAAVRHSLSCSFCKHLISVLQPYNLHIFSLHGVIMATAKHKVCKCGKGFETTCNDRFCSVCKRDVVAGMAADRFLTPIPYRTPARSFEKQELVRETKFGVWGRE